MNKTDLKKILNDWVKQVQARLDWNKNNPELSNYNDGWTDMAQDSLNYIKNVKKDWKIK